MNGTSGPILVCGATGHQGGAVARALLAASMPVRAFVRDTDDQAAKPLAELGAELVKGDLNDVGSLAAALHGVAGVFSVQTFTEEGVEGEVRQGKDVIEAARRVGVPHFVYSSVSGADTNSGVPHFESKWQIEQHLRASDLPWTVMRPVAFTFSLIAPPLRDSVLAGKLATPMRASTVMQLLSEDDYGALVTRVFANRDRWVGRTFDAASSAPTMGDMAQSLSRALRKPVAYQQVSWDEAEKQAGEEITKMQRWIEDVGYHAAPAAIAAEGVKPTSFDDYLQLHASELHAS